MKETHAACLLLGALNPAIIQPKWLVGEGIVADGKVQVKVAVPIGGDKPAGSSFEFGGHTWIATPSNLEIVASGSDADPGEALAEVLTRLPHTPVRAVGNNFHLSWPIKLEAAIAALKSPFSDMAATAKLDLIGASTTLRIAHETSQLNVTLSALDATEVVLRFNFHREATSTKDAATAARSWRADRAVAAELAEQFSRSAQ